MVGVTQRPLLPPLKHKAKTFSNTSSANNLQDLKPGSDNFFQNDLVSTVFTKTVSKDWLISILLIVLHLINWTRNLAFHFSSDNFSFSYNNFSYFRL